MVASSNIPTVSVLICVYNGEDFIAQAVESILDQTFKDFELIVVNDGSTDRTPEILADFSREDDRIVLLTQENRGIAASENLGLTLARGKYLARMDADDFSVPERLENQVQVMEAQPELVILGTSIYLINDKSELMRISLPPQDDTSIRWNLLFDNPFAQSTVMLRLAILRQNQLTYRRSFEPSDDYDLWSRILAFGKGLNLLEPTVYRRIHSGQTSKIHEQLAITAAVKIAQGNLASLGFDFSLDQVRTLRKWQRELPLINDEILVDRMFDVLNEFEKKCALHSMQFHLIRSRWILRFLLARSANSKGHLLKLKILRQLRRQDFWSLIEYLRLRRVHFAITRIK